MRSGMDNKEPGMIIQCDNEWGKRSKRTSANWDKSMDEWRLKTRERILEFGTSHLSQDRHQNVLVLLGLDTNDLTSLGEAVLYGDRRTD